MGRAAGRKNEFCDLTIRNDAIPRLSERIDAENTNTTKWQGKGTHTKLVSKTHFMAGKEDDNRYFANNVGIGDISIYTASSTHHTLPTSQP